MNNNPTVSVVMATYNGEKYISEQIDSILGQSYPVYELVIQDDCSTDSTLAIAEDYARRYPNVKVFENQRKFLEQHDKDTKANILKRTFRMHRPNEAYLSDVTYLNYGNNQTAYGSAVIDAVTGKLTGFVLSEHNDLALADSTLEWLKIASYSHKALFHTDQGSLYMSDQFQRKLKKMDMSE